jgi:hypothetical protein
MSTGLMVYVLSFAKIGSSIKNWGGGEDIQTNRKNGDPISILFFSKLGK